MSVRRNPPPEEVPDLGALEGVVSEEILDAAEMASEALDKKNIRHLLVGGLAVGAYGVARTTKDVDFLVGEEAFRFHKGGLVTLREGIPVEVHGVPIDLLSIGEKENHLIEALEEDPPEEGVPIAPIEVLIYLKLKAPRKKDAADIIELLKTDMEVDPVLDYLHEHASHLVDKFARLRKEARQEESE